MKAEQTVIECGVTGRVKDTSDVSVHYEIM